MYEDNEKKINWLGILKRLVIFIIILLLIFGFITLVTKCSKSSDSKEKTTDIQVLLDEMQSATLKYVTKDTLPTELNSSKSVKLKYLIQKDLVEELKVDSDNVCDENTSYAEITRLENNYAVKLQLNCGDKSEYRIIYIGCFDNCDGGICVGEETSTGGVCTVTTEENNTNNEETTNNTNNNNSTDNNQNNSNTNNTTTTKKSTTKSKSTTSSSKSNTSTSTNKTASVSSNTSAKSNTSSLRTLYEYEKKYCTRGTLNGNKCVVSNTYTKNGTVVVKTAGTKAYSYTVDATKSTSSTSPYAYTATIGNATPKYKTTYTNVYLSNTNVKNTNTVTYTYKGYVKGKGYWFVKTTKTLSYYTCSSGKVSGSKCVTTKYTCSSGTLSGGKCVSTKYTCSKGTLSGTKCVINVPATSATYGCLDSSYTYYQNSNTCKKEVTDYTYLDPEVKTIWSYATSVSGYTRTGNTKLQ